MSIIFHFPVENTTTILETQIESIDNLWSELKDGESTEVAISQDCEEHQIISDEMGASKQTALTATKSSSSTATTMSIALGDDDEEEDEDEDEVVEVKKIKVSTACGPSPDREIEEILSNEKTIRVLSPALKATTSTKTREIPTGRSSKVSIGTSPPPQSISTQVNGITEAFE